MAAYLMTPCSKQPDEDHSLTESLILLSPFSDLMATWNKIALH